MRDLIPTLLINIGSFGVVCMVAAILSDIWISSKVSENREHGLDDPDMSDIRIAGTLCLLLSGGAFITVAFIGILALAAYGRDILDTIIRIFG